MARKKFKLTGFARFFIVMLILAPLAYIGASYANGEDGIQNFKDLFKGKISMGNKATTDESETTKSVEIPAPSSQSSDTNQAGSSASNDAKVQSLMDENERLQKELDQKTQELEEVKAQLDAIKAAVGN